MKFAVGDKVRLVRPEYFWEEFGESWPDIVHEIMEATPDNVYCYTLFNPEMEADGVFEEEEIKAA